MSTEPVAGRSAVFQKPRLILVCFRIRDRIRAAGTSVSKKTPQEAVWVLTSIQRDFLGCSEGRVARNPCFEVELALVRAPSAEESTRPSVKLPVARWGTDYVPSAIDRVGRSRLLGRVRTVFEPWIGPHEVEC